MILLLDENVPRKLKYRFKENMEVLTVPELGWSGIKNGELLLRMHQRKISRLLSLDKNMSQQQNLLKYEISLIVIDTFDSRYKTLLPFVKKVENLILATLTPGLYTISFANLLNNAYLVIWQNK